MKDSEISYELILPTFWRIGRYYICIWFLLWGTVFLVNPVNEVSRNQSFSLEKNERVQKKSLLSSWWWNRVIVVKICNEFIYECEILNKNYCYHDLLRQTTVNIINWHGIPLREIQVIKCYFTTHYVITKNRMQRLVN